MAGDSGYIPYGMTMQPNGYFSNPTPHTIFNDLENPEGGGVNSQYVLNMPQEGNIQQARGVNMQPLHELEGYASSTGDSPWAQAQLQALQTQTQQQLGNAKTGAQAANTNAMDTIASHGGLTSGELANLATAGQNNNLNAQQNVYGQASQAAQGIRAQDEQNRIAALENLPGQEVQATQPGLQEQGLQQQNALAEQEMGLGTQQWNIQNQENQLNQLNNANNNVWNNLMQEQAGTQTSNSYAAMPNQGGLFGGGGFLGLGI